MNNKKIPAICILIFMIVVLLVLVIINLIEDEARQLKIGVVDTNMSGDYVLQYNIYNIMNNSEEQSNNVTHADMVVDIIKEQDDNCQVYLANVLREDSTGDITDVINAIYWLEENEVDIICMSLTTFEDNEQLQIAIRDVQAKGIIVVAACLNYSNEITYPAMYHNVISVANCSNENASICVLDKAVKDKLKSSKWGECSTSALTAYITGEISKQMSKSKFKIDDIIEKYNKD